MFISQIIKDAATGKKLLYTYFFERAELLWKFEDDDEKKVTRIIELVVKIEALGDVRLHAKNDHIYVKLSRRDYDHLISELGISQYGDFYLHTTLKYKALEFDEGVFAKETITLPNYEDVTE